MSELLNPYQKNSLRVSLLLFEDSLHRAGEWLDGREENGILFRCKLELSEAKRKRARQTISTALALIEKLTHTFELRTEVESASAIIRSELTVNWENLMNTQAGKLRGYGEVNPQLAGLLDSDIRNLAEIALELSAIFGESQQEKP